MGLVACAASDSDPIDPPAAAADGTTTATTSRVEVDAPSTTARPVPAEPVTTIDLSSIDVGDGPVAANTVAPLVTGFCAETHQQSFGRHPAFVVWTIDTPGVADGTDAAVWIGREIAVHTTVVDGRIEVLQGVDARGSVRFPAVEFIDGDDSLVFHPAPVEHPVGNDPADARTCLGVG